EGGSLARQGRRKGGQRPGPGDPGADRRHSARHLDRHLRVRPPPLLQALPAHARGGHHRARADGHRRGGGPRRRAHPTRRPRGRTLQHKLRALLLLRPEPLLPVRDHARHRQARRDGEPARAGQGRQPLRLHARLRRRARRAGRVPARPAGPLRSHKGPRGAAGRALPLPLRRAADELAGRRLRGRTGGGDRRDLGPRPDRPDVRQDRHAHGRRARHRRGQRPRAPHDGLQTRRPDHRLLGGRQRQGRHFGPHGREGRGLRHRRRGHGGRRVARGFDPPGHQGTARPGDGAARLDVRRQARRDPLAHGRVRRPHPGLPARGPLRHADPAAHGPGEREAVGGRHNAAPHRRGPSRRRGPQDPHHDPRRRAARVRDLPEETGRRHQVRAQAL
ncbi:MAG: Threonine dehydrogenase and related Zn-dependent dehydrogenases, partial [uncultured Rubrobacteraceae bacterium]